MFLVGPHRVAARLPGHHAGVRLAVTPGQQLERGFVRAGPGAARPVPRVWRVVKRVVRHEAAAVQVSRQYEGKLAAPGHHRRGFRLSHSVLPRLGVELVWEVPIKVLSVSISTALDALLVPFVSKLKTVGIHGG